MRKFVLLGATLGQNATFEAAHGEEQVRVVLAVDRHEAVLPLHRSDCSRQPVLDVPEDGAAQIHVMLHKAHAGITWPAFLVVVAHNVFVVRIGVFGQVTLN